MNRKGGNWKKNCGNFNATKKNQCQIMREFWARVKLVWLYEKKGHHSSCLFDHSKYSRKKKMNHDHLKAARNCHQIISKSVVLLSIFGHKNKTKKKKEKKKKTERKQRNTMGIEFWAKPPSAAWMLHYKHVWPSQ